MEYSGFAPIDSEGNVTKFAPHKALKSIVCSKLTFDGRVVAHRVGGACMAAMLVAIQGYLAYKKTHPPRTLP